MKTPLAAAALLAALATPAFAQQSGMDGMKEMEGARNVDAAAAPAPSASAVHKGTGIVMKLDPVTDRVTIAHGPVPTMNWPAMSMTFRVKDKTIANKLTVKKRVDFEFVQEGRDYVVTAIR